jgi:hypothetical protein
MVHEDAVPREPERATLAAVPPLVAQRSRALFMHP